MISHAEIGKNKSKKYIFDHRVRVRNIEQSLICWWFLCLYVVALGLSLNLQRANPLLLHMFVWNIRHFRIETNQLASVVACLMSHVVAWAHSRLAEDGERESHEKKKNISKWFGRICIVIVVCILRVGLGSLSRIRSSFLSGLHEVVNERWLQKTKLRVQVSNWFQHEHDFSSFVDMINNTKQQNSTHIHERISNLGVFLLYRLPEYIHLLFFEFNPQQLANN